MSLLSGSPKQLRGFDKVTISTQALEIVKTEVELCLRFAFVGTGFEKLRCAVIVSSGPRFHCSVEAGVAS